MFLTLGTTIKQQPLDQLREVNSFGLLLDEVTVVVTTEQLVSFVKYVGIDGKALTKFLSVQDVLSKSTSANAATICQLILDEIEECQLPPEKMTGLSTDGANVMVGKNNGVMTKLKLHSTNLLNVHCICHKLALPCFYSNGELKYIKEMETILPLLWKFLVNVKIQEAMKALSVSKQAC
ncbi:zinc finger protein 862-like [Glandiceps talaboti]